MRYIYILLALVLLAITWMQYKPSGKSSHELSRLKWMIGTWKNETPEGTFYEAWKEQSDSVLEGSGIMIVGKDTVFAEALLLKETQTGIQYIVTIGNQNEGKPETFDMTRNTDQEVMFENKLHDFPQQIIYRNPQPDSLYAVVQGMQNGKFRSEIFAMKKMKE